MLSTPLFEKCTTTVKMEKYKKVNHELRNYFGSRTGAKDEYEER